MSTSVHLPPDLARSLAETANREGISRNRLIVKACRYYLRDKANEWPPELFEPLPAEELDELRSATNELERAIRRSRRSKGSPL